MHPKWISVSVVEISITSPRTRQLLSAQFRSPAPPSLSDRRDYADEKITGLLTEGIYWVLKRVDQN